MKINNAIKKYNKNFIKRRTYSLMWSLVRFVIIVGLAFIILYPVFFRFMVSIKSAADLNDPTVVFIPKHPTFNNYKTLLSAVNYFKTFFITAGFTLLTSILQISSCTMVAYGLARFTFRGRGIIFTTAMLSLIVPPQTMVFPLFIRFKYFNPIALFTFTGGINGLDLTNTLIPFILLSATAMAVKNGLYIFLLRQHFKNMPYVLEEAAYIDGCGPFATFLRIMTPGALPMIITVFLFSFVWQWNDYIYSSILAPGLPLLSTKLLGLKFLSLESYGDIYNAMLSTPKFFLLVTPLVILYFFTQRFFTESIERSGTVG